MAGLLGFGGPKRLVLTLLAMAAVSEASLRGVAGLSLVVVYIAIATSLVSIPVGVVMVTGERAAAIIGRGQSWMTTNAVALRVWLALGVSLALIVDALWNLLR